MTYLTRREPKCNVSRFYALHLQLDLFGPVSVVREWGRIESPGTARHEFARQRTFGADGDAGTGCSQVPAWL